SVIPRACGVSSTPRLLDFTMLSLEYWIAQSSRAMTTMGVARRRRRWRNGSARCCALRGGIHGVERLARGHEQAVALGAAEADVAAHLGQADATDELAGRGPHRDAAIADVATGIARGPDIAVDVTAHAVRPTVHAVDHEVAEPLLIGEPVVGTDVEHVHVALAAGTGIAWALAR